jgi:AraC family transcriptional regulator
LLRVIRRDPGFSSFEAAVLVAEFLGALGKNPVNEKSRPQWLDTAYAMMREVDGRALKLRDIAGTVGVHAYHLAQTFRKFEGCSAGDYLRASRLNAATSLLRDSNLTLAEVATSCGYADQSHFTRSLTAQYGMTPAQFRHAIA